MKVIMKILLLTLVFISALFADNRKLKIAIPSDMTPYAFIEEGNIPNGILVDFWKLWAKKNNQQIEFISSNWLGTLEAIKNKEADIHSGLFKNNERAEFLDFLEPIYRSESHIYLNKELEKDIKSTNDIGNKIIGIENGSFYDSYLQENYPNAKIKRYDTFSKMFTAMKNREINLLIEDSLIIQRFLMKDSSFNKVSILPKFELYKWFYAAIKKDDKELKKLVTNGIKKISSDELLDLERKWVVKDKFKNLKKTNSILSLEEKNWLLSNQDISLAISIDWVRYSYIDLDGKLKGFHLDLIDQINKNLKINNIKYEAFDNWNQAFSSVKAGGVDGILGLSWSKEREKFFNYSPSYHSGSYYIVARQDEVATLLSNFNNKTAVTYEKSITNKIIKEKAPQVKIIHKNSVQEILKALENKEADVAALEGAKELDLEKYGLKIVNLIYTKYSKFHIGTPKNKKIVQSIIKKGIDSISEKQMKVLKDKWLNKKIVFTNDELIYIKNSPTLKVGIEDWAGIINTNDEKKLEGIAGELVQKAFKISGLKIKYTKGIWDDLLKSFKEGNIDILPASIHTKPRDEYGYFTDKYFGMKHYIYVRAANDSINSLADLEGKKLAMQKDAGTVGLVKKLYPKINIVEIKDLEELIQKVLNGEVDALFEAQIAVQNKMKEQLITNLKSVSQYSLKDQGLHIFLKKDKLLRDILNKSLALIPQKEKNAIISKWLYTTDEIEDVNNGVDFTKEELDFIKKKKTVTFSNVNWEPMSIVNKDEITGLFYDYIKIIEKRTGLEFKFVKSKSWTEVLKKFREKKIDVVPNIGDAAFTFKNGIVSDSVVGFKYAIVTNKKGTYLDGLKELNGKTIALPKGYSSHILIKNKFPKIKVIEAKDVPESLKMVSKNEVDAFVGHSAVVIHNIQNGFPDLKIIGLSEEYFNHYFLMQDKYPLLQSIINKAILSITIQEKQKIKDKWIRTEVNTALDYSVLYRVIAIFVFILLIILIFTKKLSYAKKEIEKRNKKIEDTLMELEDSNHELETTIDNLKQTQEQLIEAEKMASLAGLVAGVAHEINTPIGIGLTGSTHLSEITSDIKKSYDSDAMTQKSFENYLRTSDELSKLVTNNLEKAANLVKSFKQVAVDQASEEKRIFNLRVYIDEILVSLNNILKKTKLNITIICENDIKINSYPGAISQILTNLIMNSIIHGYKENEKGIITVEVKQVDSKLLITYKDDGKGIPKENITKIFDPFFTTNREKGGSGLGLNIIYNIVSSNLNGKIKYIDKNEKGVEFEILIPLENKY